MGTQRKVDLVMNAMYNLLLAVLLSVLAELINAGGVTWPAIAADTAVSYILEMLISVFLPFTDWGHKAALKRAKPGTKKFRFITAGVTSIPYATLMSAAMSFYTCILTLHLPAQVWLAAWMRIWFLFIAVAWICSFLFVPAFIELAKRILHIPKEYNPFEKQ